MSNKQRLRRRLYWRLAWQTARSTARVFHFDDAKIASIILVFLHRPTRIAQLNKLISSNISGNYFDSASDD